MTRMRLYKMLHFPVVFLIPVHDVMTVATSSHATTPVLQHLVHPLSRGQSQACAKSGGWYGRVLTAWRRGWSGGYGRVRVARLWGEESKDSILIGG